MNDLANALRTLIDTARQADPRVQAISIAAIEKLLGPERHVLHVRDTDGGWNLQHVRNCRKPSCTVAALVSACLLVTSPHAIGHTYQVWLEDGGLKFHEVTR
jgi:hypothetical protein